MPPEQNLDPVVWNTSQWETGARPGCPQSPQIIYKMTTLNSTTGSKIMLLKLCLVLKTDRFLLTGAQESGPSLQLLS